MGSWSRAFGLAAAVAIAVPGAGGCSVGRTPLVREALPARQAAPPREPPQFRSDSGMLRVRIVVERRQVRMAGRTLWSLTYNGSYLPPTLRLQPGDRMDFTMVNHVRPRTDLHVQGLSVTPVDGSVFLHIPPGGTFHHIFRFPRTLSPGTYWYHSYVSPGADAMDGISGLIVVEGLRRHLPPNLRNISRTSARTGFRDRPPASV